MHVRRLQEQDWPTLRECRLSALRDAPEVFASPLSEEELLGEDAWRRRAAGGPAEVMFMAFVGEEPAGLAGAYLDGDVTEPELVSMWVDPRFRHQGAGAALVEAVAEWARDAGFPGIYLRVSRRAAEARRLYERCGFVATGEASPFPLDQTVIEDKLRRVFPS